MPRSDESPRLASPRLRPLPKVVAEGPESRSGLYRLAPLHPGLFRKCGRATFVDLDVLDAIRRNYPIAKIK